MTQQWNEHGDEEVHLSQDSGGEGGEAGYAAPSKPKMNSSTMALVIAFAAALAVLYLLGLQNKLRTASAEQVAHDQKMQSAISELLQKNGKAEQIQNLFKDTDKLVQMFYNYLGAHASASVELPENPFEQGTQSVAAPSANHEAVSMVSNNAAEAESLRRVADTYSKLKLKSVMIGKSPMAVINGKVYQAGNKIGDLTVTSIDANRVLLSYGKNTFELKLADPNADRP